MITGYIKGQNLTIRTPMIAADTIDYLTAQFVFQTVDWEGCRLFSHWKCGETNYTIELSDAGKIEKEQHLNLTAGTWTVWIHGERYRDRELIQRITTDEATLTVTATGTAGGSPFPEVPASDLERINAEIAELQDKVGSGGGAASGDAMRLLARVEVPYEGTPPIIDMIDFSRKYTFLDIAEAYVAGRTITLNTEHDLVPYQYGMFWLDHLSSHGIEFHGHYRRVKDVEADVEEGWVPAVAFLREDGTLTIEDREWSGYAKQAEVDSLSEAIADYEKKPLKGKKVSFIGDSICAGADTESSYLGGYGKIIADRNNMVYENLAKGGATITAETYSHSTGSAKMWITRKVDELSADADYVIVEGGVNDAWQYIDHRDIVIGAISDGYNATLDDTTYYGAFESMLKKLITRYQGKKIGYIAIPRTMNLYSNSESVPNFYHIALECCAKWGVPVCDLNTITPPSECLGTEYVADGTHPTYEGYLKYYCDPIEAWMKTLTTGGNNVASVALKAVEEYTKGFNDAIKALQDGKLDNTGISFRKALLPLADGTTVEIDVLTAVSGTVIIPYINQVPLSINTDKTIYGSDYNGDGKNDGYLKGYRLSSSGVEKVLTVSAVTGFIPVKNGDVIRINGCEWASKQNAKNYICGYNSEFNFIGAKATVAGDTFSLTDYSTSIFSQYSVDDDCNITLTLDCATIAYIRVSSLGDGSEDKWNYDPADMIITVNEEIS